jgi:hypothetical protein
MCIVLQGQLHATNLIDICGQGNDIIKKAVSSTVELIDRYPEKETILVVDQPTWHRGDDFFGIPLLITPMRTVLKSMVGLDYPGIESVRLHTTNVFDESFPQISRSALDAASLDPHTLVLIHDSDTGKMVPYDPTSL